jgi:hypothetical protein
MAHLRVTRRIKAARRRRRCYAGKRATLGAFVEALAFRGWLTASARWRLVDSRRVTIRATSCLTTASSRCPRPLVRRVGQCRASHRSEPSKVQALRCCGIACDVITVGRWRRAARRNALSLSTVCGSRVSVPRLIALLPLTVPMNDYMRHSKTTRSHVRLWGPVLAASILSCHNTYRRFDRA